MPSVPSLVYISKGHFSSGVAVAIFVASPGLAYSHQHHLFPAVGTGPQIRRQKQYGSLEGFLLLAHAQSKGAAPCKEAFAIFPVFSRKVSWDTGGPFSQNSCIKALAFVGEPNGINSFHGTYKDLRRRNKA